MLHIYNNFRAFSCFFVVKKGENHVPIPQNQFVKKSIRIP